MKNWYHWKHHFNHIMCFINLFSPQHAFPTTRFGFTEYRPFRRVLLCLHSFTVLTVPTYQFFSPFILASIFFSTSNCSSTLSALISPALAKPPPRLVFLNPWQPSCTDRDAFLGDCAYSWTSFTLLHAPQRCRHSIGWFFVMVDLWKSAILGFENTSGSHSVCACVSDVPLSCSIPQIDQSIILSNGLAFLLTHVSHVIFITIPWELLLPSQHSNKSMVPLTNMSKSRWLFETAHQYSKSINTSKRRGSNCITLARIQTYVRTNSSLLPTVEIAHKPIPTSSVKIALVAELQYWAVQNYCSTENSIILKNTKQKPFKSTKKTDEMSHIKVNVTKHRISCEYRRCKKQV